MGFSNQALEFFGIKGPGWFVDPLWTKPAWCNGNVVDWQQRSDLSSRLKGFLKSSTKLPQLMAHALGENTPHHVAAAFPHHFFQVVTSTIALFRFSPQPISFLAPPVDGGP
jgi:hypothetical protein